MPWSESARNASIEARRKKREAASEAAELSEPVSVQEPAALDVSDPDKDVIEEAESEFKEKFPLPEGSSIDIDPKEIDSLLGLSD